MPLFWAAGIGAVGQIAGGLISGNAASSAADKSAAGAAAATAEQKREYDINVARQQPWLTTGSSALSQLAKIYGLDSYSFNQPSGGASGSAGGSNPNDAATLAQIRQGAQAWENAIPGNGRGIIQKIDSGASLQDVTSALNSLRSTTTNPQNTAFLDPLITQASSAAATSGAGVSGTFQPGAATTGQPGAAPDYSSFYKSPDYQFRMKESLDALTAQQAKLGLLDSGATQKATIQRAGDIASGDFNTYANRLQALAGVGQTTATNLGAAGQNYATNVGNIAQNSANTAANASIYQGQTYANAVGQLAGIGQGLFSNNGAQSGANNANYSYGSGTGAPGSWSDFGYAN